MNAPTPAAPAPAEPITRHAAVTNALRYWEPRRLPYCAALALVVLLYAAPYLMAHWREAPWGYGLAGLFLLAVVANICYCTIYPVDVFVQMSAYRDLWLSWRWVLFVVGTLVGAALAVFVCGPVFQVLTLAAQHDAPLPW